MARKRTDNTRVIENIMGAHAYEPGRLKTLCGRNPIGRTVYGKITCPDCIRIIKFCKGINSRNLQLGV